jgi:hypothetical protein
MSGGEDSGYSRKRSQSNGNLAERQENVFVLQSTRRLTARG